MLREFKYEPRLPAPPGTCRLPTHDHQASSLQLVVLLLLPYQPLKLVAAVNMHWLKEYMTHCNMFASVPSKLR